ncbi:MAG TPA: hypothetical protein VN843_03005, partial [Anaerolineales bacterium]|nr:hypothetical protein [Anaerolineales bacterium]
PTRWFIGQFKLTNPENAPTRANRTGVFSFSTYSELINFARFSAQPIPIGWRSAKNPSTHLTSVSGRRSLAELLPDGRQSSQKQSQCA